MANYQILSFNHPVTDKPRVYTIAARSYLEGTFYDQGSNTVKLLFMAECPYHNQPKRKFKIIALEPGVNFADPQLLRPLCSFIAPNDQGISTPRIICEVLKRARPLEWLNVNPEDCV